MIEDLRNQAERYKIGEYDDNSLWLADDAVIIAKNEPSLLKTLDVLEETGWVNGLKLSREKTKVMRIREARSGRQDRKI